MWAAGLTLTVSGPNYSIDLGREAVAAAVGHLQVPEAVLESVAVQAVQPLHHVTYDVARQRAASSILGPLLGPGVAVTDWSILLDGRSENPPCDFKVEFGVVSAAELPARLTRDVGRMGDPMPNAAVAQRNHRRR